MKLVFIVFLALATVRSCGDFEIVRATSQPWAGGISASKGGVNYTLILVALQNSEVLTFDQLWVKKDYYRVHSSRKMPSEATRGFAVNDTIYIRATKVNGTETPTRNRPEGFAEEWVVGYELKGKRLYRGVGGVVKLKHKSNP